jgi:dTDP-4-dehydrorhamnose 3,5-epimerase
VKILELERSFLDDGGELVEIARLQGEGKLEPLPEFRLGQITYTRLEPGTVKAWHLHKKQTDLWFVPAASRLLLGLVDLRKDSPSVGERMRFVGGAGRRRLVLIPPGVAHGLSNPYRHPAELIYLTDQHFDAADEHRLPWDYFGKEFWRLRKD